MTFPEPALLNLFPPSPARPVAADPVKRLRVLRLSVTDRCNFRCCYCMPAKGGAPATPDSVLPLQELFAHTAWIVMHTPIERVRLTGGEPLVHPQVEDLIRHLTALPQLQEISLTTNGTLLARKAAELKAAGLSRVNVSLDSMNPARFSEITRGGKLEQTLRGIDAACDAGLTPIKLNTVLRRSTWKEEVYALLDYAASNGFEVRFIELMRTGTERAWCDSEYVGVDEVLAWLQKHTVVESIDSGSATPARNTRLLWRGKTVITGWISPRSHPFCAACERLRMDAYGQLRRCLMDPFTLDLPALRHQNRDERAVTSFLQYLSEKHPPLQMDTENVMSQIGG